MPASTERRVAWTLDLDGPVFRGITANMVTAAGIILRKDDGLLREETLLGKVSAMYHLLQPVQRHAMEGLSQIRELGEYMQWDLTLIGLSDRGSHLSEITRRRLAMGGMKSFFDKVMLNDGSHPTVWKPSVVEGLIREGNTVVHVDDDIRRGLAIAEVNGSGLTYVLSNLSTLWPLRAAAGIRRFPERFYLVRDLKAAVRHAAVAIDG